MTRNSVFSETALDLVSLRRRSRELAGYIEDIAEQPLSFRGPYPIEHSAANHRHLWMIEAAADRDTGIDLAFRVRAAGYILGRWRDRLPSYAPARERGFRLYLYEDLAPTISVVAETGYGCPYGGDLTFVRSIDEVLAPFAKRSWISNFQGTGPSPEAIIDAAQRNAGSLRQTSAYAGLGVADLRRTIEVYGIAREFNDIRKRNGRRPARFADAHSRLPRLKIWEWRLAPER